MRSRRGKRLILVAAVVLGSALQLRQVPTRAAPATPAAPASQAGYWIVGSTGTVRSFGHAPLLGSAPARLAHPVVGLTATPSGRGYWLVAADGGVFAFGDAVFRGSTGAIRLNRQIVGMAATSSGDGYWLVAADGGIFSYGGAAYLGSTGRLRLNQPILGMAPTPSGRGYWLVAADGGIFSFGDARFFGSTGAIRLNQPIVGMTATPTGRGYWLVAADGGIFSFGDARFFGSTGAIRLNQPIVGMSATPTGRGYWLVAADGGVFSFGDARFLGSATGLSRVAGMAVQPPPRAPQSDGRPTTTMRSTTTTTAGKRRGARTTTTTTPRPPPAVSGSSFQIGLIGDTGYDAEQDSQLLAVRAHMAAFPLAFVAHDGDIGSPGEPCDDGAIGAVKEIFDGFAAPFVYTPGDNEWQNCNDPRGRLDALRRTFFSTPTGQGHLPVQRQEGYVENARWVVEGVYFATLNVPGPTGGGVDTGAEQDWLNQTFDAAEAAGSPGVMIIWQDNPFDGTGNRTLLATLERRTVAFARPVVLVHGDTHSHTLDQPWEDVANFIRLETYAGSQADHWVRVTVDPAAPGVFSFSTERAS